MSDVVATPSKRIKRLHRKSGNKEVSLKDYAVELSSNGTKEEKQLVEDWLTSKAEGRAVKAEKPQAAPAKAVEPPKKFMGKKKN